MTKWIEADWPAPQNIKAYATTRGLGNLALHVDDDPEVVNANRMRLQTTLHTPSIEWLNQTHSTKIVHLAKTTDRNADGAFVDAPGKACVILTGDCLPLLLCDEEGQAVAAVHCGWRGLSNGIIETVISHFKMPRANLLAWLGPAISAPAYEIDAAVRDAFPEDAKDIRCFLPNERGRWQASLYQLATNRLYRLGVERVYGGKVCTYRDAEQFYSYRQDPKTGRIATLIWMT